MTRRTQRTPRYSSGIRRSGLTGNSFASPPRASSSSRGSSSLAAAGLVSRSRSTRHRPPASFQPTSVTRVIDQHPPHRLVRGGEEVRFAIEVLVADEPPVSLMHKGGRVEGVPGPFPGHPRGRELPQLVVVERQRAGRRLAVASRGGFQEMSDLGHNDRVYRLHHNVRTEAPLGPPSPRSYIQIDVSAHGSGRTSTRLEDSPILRQA